MGIINCTKLIRQISFVRAKIHRRVENDENYIKKEKGFTYCILYTIIRKNNKEAKAALSENPSPAAVLHGFLPAVTIWEEDVVMRERKIKMTPAEVEDFVHEASKCDFDIDISYNHYTVDAKSILGVMGLNFRSILTLHYAGYNDEFEDFVEKLAVV